MRGEYGKLPLFRRLFWELPPRARRIQGNKRGVGFFTGTTSACAENTFHRRRSEIIRVNYLRVRGEYLTDTHTGPETAELPPRARRILSLWFSLWIEHGTTSACAENTFLSCLSDHLLWNYLRVRGEYRIRGLRQTKPPELPPRARRIPRQTPSNQPKGGTTSACAENTGVFDGFGLCWWNYLRVRGEYSSSMSARSLSLELPPRARRILHLVIVQQTKLRTTSACAENTGSDWYRC